MATKTPTINGKRVVINGRQVVYNTALQLEPWGYVPPNPKPRVYIEDKYITSDYIE